MGDEGFGSGGKKRGAMNGVKPISKDCMKVLGMDYMDDGYIINVKRILGSYLSDTVRRFDVLVNLIVKQLLAGNKITETQVDVVKGVLGHTLEKETSSLIGSNNMNDVSLPDVLNFCRRPDVRDSLLISDKSSGIISEVTTEYESLLCLFRIPGDFISPHRDVQSNRTPAASGNITAAIGPLGTSPKDEAVTQRGFYSCFKGKPYGTNGLFQTPQPTPQLVGSPAGYVARVDPDHASYIISRAHDLASDSHLGKFLW